MLLDSGADVTLVPEECVVRLAAEVDADAAYELAGFDGARSVARAAQLQLVVLGRTFKGRFLLIRDPCEVLGRNILNHLALLLDGPALSWRETGSPKP